MTSVSNACSVSLQETLQALETDSKGRIRYIGVSLMKHLGAL